MSLRKETIMIHFFSWLIVFGGIVYAVAALCLVVDAIIALPAAYRWCAGAVRGVHNRVKVQSWER